MNRIDSFALCSESIVQALYEKNYISDPEAASKLIGILGLPHFHHHEKRSVTKNASAISLTKQGLHPSASFIINNLNRRGSNESCAKKNKRNEQPQSI